MSKICLYCGINFSPYMNRSSQKYCKNCSKKAKKIYKHNWYEKDKERVLNKRKRYFQEHKKEELERTKKWRLENSEKTRIQRVKDSKIERKKYPKKIRARMIANKKIIISEKKMCEICKNNKAEHRHHKDYQKPLEVRFVCIPCHSKLHKINRGNIHGNV